MDTAQDPAPTRETRSPRAALFAVTRRELAREAATAWLRRDPELRFLRSDELARAEERARAQSRSAPRSRALAIGLKLAAPLFLAYGLMFNFSVVRGSSMSPGIHDGDRILVDHLSYVFQDVERGDIVVLQYPLDPSLDYIKRVIGLPGDEVRITHGDVFVNGERLDEPYVAEQDSASDVAARVEAGTYFVLGDNRPHSSDSREFGFVPRVYLRGKVDLRVWPPSRAGTLE